MESTRVEVPDFATDEEEATFWETHSTAPYWDQLEPVEIQMSPHARTKAISIRIREEYLEALKRTAKRKGIPYQTLMKLWLVERLRDEGALEEPGA